MQLTATVKGTLLNRLRERAAKVVPTVVVRLEVPPDEDVAWWYYHEYGTATHNEVNPGGTYPIVPVNKDMLAFPGSNGEIVLTSKVEAHPGVKASHIVSDALPELRDDMRERVDTALKKGGLDSPEVMKQVAVEAMTECRERVITNIATRLPGTSPPSGLYEGGKLKGRTAADVFTEKSVIVELE